jgi:hypothetical protein
MFWRKAVRRQLGSGGSIRDWCRRQGLKESLFHWWRRQISKRDLEGVGRASGEDRGAELPTRSSGARGNARAVTAGSSGVGRRGAPLRTRPAFVPVRVTSGSWTVDEDPPGAAAGGPPSRIEIVLPHERCVRVIGPVDRQALADVLAIFSNDLWQQEAWPGKAGVDGSHRSAWRGARPC